MHVRPGWASRVITYCGGKPHPDYNHSGCGGEIEHKEPIVVCTWWHSRRMYNKYYHKTCFWEGYELWWERNPYRAPESSRMGGRKQRLFLTPEQTKQRAYVAVKASNIRKRMREVVDLGLSDWREAKASLDIDYNALAAEYEECGGLPVGWFK